MTPDPADGLPAVEAQGVEYTYPARRSRRGAPASGPAKALAGPDFLIAPGEVYGFLGPNGGGKTTLFRILATLAAPERGSIRVFGADLRSQAREVPIYDVLTDVATIWPAGEDAVWNETLLESLAELRPDVYTGWTAQQLTAALSTHGVSVRQIGRRIDGKTVNRRGPDHTAITTAITERKQKTAG